MTCSGPDFDKLPASIQVICLLIDAAFNIAVLVAAVVFIYEACSR